MAGSLPSSPDSSETKELEINLACNIREKAIRKRLKV